MFICHISDFDDQFPEQLGGLRSPREQLDFTFRVSVEYLVPHDRIAYAHDAGYSEIRSQLTLLDPELLLISYIIIVEIV